MLEFKKVDAGASDSGSGSGSAITFMASVSSASGEIH